MNKTPRLSNSDIEYLDKVWNFSSGCGKGCPYCYAEKITKRFTNHYPCGFEPTLYPEALLSPLYLKKPSHIGVCYMGDLFWYCPKFDPDKVIEGKMAVGFGVLGTATLKETIQAVMTRCPQHTFVFLTKQPQNLSKWGSFPDNAWVGVSATDNTSLDKAMLGLSDIVASKRFISFEPLLLPVNFSEEDAELLDWVIIGSQTKPNIYPQIEWVREITQACDKAGIPVFLKNNLDPLLGQMHEYKKWQGVDDDGNNLYGLRQELPK